jgi:hypothetical protein
MSSSHPGVRPGVGEIAARAIVIFRGAPNGGEGAPGPAAPAAGGGQVHELARRMGLTHRQNTETPPACEGFPEGGGASLFTLCLDGRVIAPRWSAPTPKPGVGGSVAVKLLATLSMLPFAGGTKGPSRCPVCGDVMLTKRRRGRSGRT